MVFPKAGVSQKIFSFDIDTALCAILGDRSSPSRRHFQTSSSTISSSSCNADYRDPCKGNGKKKKEKQKEVKKKKKKKKQSSNEKWSLNEFFVLFRLLYICFAMKLPLFSILYIRQSFLYFNRFLSFFLFLFMVEGFAAKSEERIFYIDYLYLIIILALFEGLSC